MLPEGGGLADFTTTHNRQTRRPGDSCDDTSITFTNLFEEAQEHSTAAMHAARERALVDMALRAVVKATMDAVLPHALQQLPPWPPTAMHIVCFCCSLHSLLKRVGFTLV